MEDQLARLRADLAVAAHNFREPLRMIRCYADLLRDPGEDAPACAERIIHSARRLESLMNGLFECVQLSENYSPRRIDLNMVQRHGLTMLPEPRPLVTAASLPSIHGDFDMLAEVFQRLFDNAVKYRATEPVEIDVSSEELEGEWRISVRDNGIGIEAQYWERCFGMFKRLHGQAIPGEGFGLAYSRAAVELHGGRMWMESTPGSGTTIFFTLPAA